MYIALYFDGKGLFVLHYEIINDPNEAKEKRKNEKNFNNAAHYDNGS